MLTLTMLKTYRLSREISRPQLSAITGIRTVRLRALELREAEPWFDEALILHRAFCTPGLNNLILSDSLTLSSVESPLPTDLVEWVSGVRAPLSLAVRVAIRCGLDDPCHLAPSPLFKQVWAVLEASERHPEAPGWCPWCGADIFSGDPHLPTCLPNNLFAARGGIDGVDETLAYSLAPKTRVTRRRGIKASGLKTLRVEREMLQKDVADAIGIHPNTYARIERGALPLTVDNADRLAKLYNVHRAVVYAVPDEGAGA